MRDSVRIPIDPDSLPNDVATLRAMLSAQAVEMAEQVAMVSVQQTELAAERAGLLEQRYEIETLRERLTRALRVAFGRSSEKLRDQLEQLELTLADLDERIADEVAPVRWTLHPLSREVLLCRRPAPPYSPEFRHQIVDLVRSGCDPSDLTREFEPSAQAIRNWVAQADRQGGRTAAKTAAVVPAMTADERDELTRLRRENKQLRVERLDARCASSLSRAAAWFARETGAVPSGSFGS